MMGLVIQQASFGFSASLNAILSSLPASLWDGEWAILVLLFILTILGVDFLVWAMKLSRTFTLTNIVLNFVSTTLTLVLVQILADEGFEINSGVIPVALLGIAIPLIYWRNFGYLMNELDLGLQKLKRLINPFLALMSTSLLVGALWSLFSSWGPEPLFSLIVYLMFFPLGLYVWVGWSRLFNKEFWRRWLGGSGTTAPGGHIS